MTDPVNLRQFRKKKKRADDEANAQENRILFGRTKLEKDFDERQKNKTVRFLDVRKIPHDK